MTTNPGPEKVAIDPVTEPVAGVACTFMMCARPKPPRTDDDRPAIRQLKLPDAEPESAKATFIATCENASSPTDAVPPPER